MKKAHRRSTGTGEICVLILICLGSLLNFNSLMMQCQEIKENHGKRVEYAQRKMTALVDGHFCIRE